MPLLLTVLIYLLSQVYGKDCEVREISCSIMVDAEGTTRYISRQNGVNNPEKSYSVTVSNSSIPALCVENLNVSHPTYILDITHTNLKTIHPGALDRQQIAYEISITHNQIETIESGTFRSLQIVRLDLSFNQISILENGAFTNLKFLKHLRLVGNKLVRLKQSWFWHTPKIQSLWLDENYLAELGDNTFRFTEEKDVILSVSKNDLRVISPKAFDGIEEFSLWMDFNKVEELPEEMFTDKSVVVFSAQHNRIAKLPESFFDQVRMKYADLSGNPVNCYTLDKLLVWRRLYGVDVETSMRTCSNLLDDDHSDE